MVYDKNMRIGYACLTRGIPDTDMHSCTMRNATPEKLSGLIGHNLNSLKNMLVFNAENNIRLFRISSDLIPFGSSPVNTLDWRAIFAGKFAELADFIKHSGIRVSMHPGQYTVINSPKPDVVARAIQDLIYHENLLSALQTGASSKIILHIGGVYGDKKEAVKRFDAVYCTLDDSIKERLAIENDDKSYNIKDALETGTRNGIPVIYDNLHSEVNPYGTFPHSYWIEKCAATWNKKDGEQKIHYSQQAQGKTPGSHSETIDARIFTSFLDEIKDSSPDIMLEVKDKNISAVKCANTLSRDKNALLADWRRYEFKILEMSPAHHAQATKLISYTRTDPLEFYEVLDSALNETPSNESKILAARAILETFFKDADADDKKYISEKLALFSSGKYPYAKIKSFLFKAALKYEENGLYSSFYFHL